MPSKFGGIPIDDDDKDTAISESKYGGIPLDKPSQITEPSAGKQFIESYARPVLQGLGSAVGGLMGGAGGAAGGPAAPATIPAGAIAGGALGYAIGDEVADLLENVMGMKEVKPLMLELTESGKDILTGATWEMGGAALVPGVKAVGKGLSHIPGVKTAIETGKEALKKIPALQAKSISKRAGEVLAANTTPGTPPLIAKNREEAHMLEEMIPGLKFTRAQLTGDPSMIKFERAIAREPGTAAAEQAERMAQNSDAIMKFLELKKGKGLFQDTLKMADAEQQLSEKGVMTARKGLEEEISKLSAGKSTIEAGQAIREVTKEGEKIARKEAGKLFESAPEEIIDIKPIIDKIDELSKPLSKFEDISSNIPPEFSRVKSVLKDTKQLRTTGPEGTVAILKETPKITTNDLQGLRSELTERLRDMKSMPQRNRRMESRINKLIGTVDNTLDTAAGEQLKKARKFFKREVIDKFNTGAPGEILKQTHQGDKIIDAQIVSKFFKKGIEGTTSMQQFINAVGDNPKANQAMKDAIKHDLVTKLNPVTGEITESNLKGWLKQYKPALSELGLTKEFDTVVKARSQLDDAIKYQNYYNKSEASKLLNADLSKSVQSAFSKGPKAKAASNLMRQIEGNPKAIAGLQNEMIDYITRTSQENAKELISQTKLNKLIRDYTPALNVVFKDSPEKLKALKITGRAYKRLQATLTSPLGAGSDTAENMATMLSKSLKISGGRLGYFVRAFMEPLKNLSDTEINKIINRSILDPEFADFIIRFSKKPQQLKNNWPTTLAKMGLITTGQEKE